MSWQCPVVRTFGRFQLRSFAIRQRDVGDLLSCTMTREREENIVQRRLAADHVDERNVRRVQLPYGVRRHPGYLDDRNTDRSKGSVLFAVDQDLATGKAGKRRHHLLSRVERRDTDLEYVAADL